MQQKKATLEGIKLAAMVDELRHMPQEKLAINLAPVGDALASVGSKALGGLANAATKIAPTVATKAPGLGSALANAPGHMVRMGNAVGARRMGQLAGGAIVGGGALAGLGAVNAATRRQ